MSARNGDKSRHGRLKKAAMARRLKSRELREQIKATASAKTHATKSETAA